MNITNHSRLSNKICEEIHIAIDQKKFEKGACLNFIKFVLEIVFVQVCQKLFME